MEKYKDILTNAVLLIFLILADQATKYIIRFSGGFYVCNSNIALGIKLHELLFWITWIVIVSWIIFNFFNFQFSISKYLNFQFFGLTFILSGALSNVIDRLYFGCVIDFIDLKFWPVFNLADVFITTGVILILLDYFRKSKLT